MEILTNLHNVFESSNNCPGCGSILGLKFIMQTVEDLKKTVIITSPGDIALMGKAGLKANFINSRDPAATAKGLAASNSGMNIIVYSGDGFTKMNLPTILSARENFTYICYNNSGYANMNMMTPIKEFARLVMHNAVYAATSSVAYYEDFIAKLRKSFSKTGFKFIDLLAPCPALWKYDTSNTIEIGRMATETLMWPLYEIENNTISITKTPPSIEQFQRLAAVLKLPLSAEEVQHSQDYFNRRWKALGEGKIS